MHRNSLQPMRNCALLRRWRQDGVPHCVLLRSPLPLYVAQAMLTPRIGTLAPYTVDHRSSGIGGNPDVGARLREVRSLTVFISHASRAPTAVSVRRSSVDR